MDPSLIDFIKSKNVNGIIQHFDSIKITKKTVSYIVDFFSLNYVSSNIWIMRYIYEKLKKFEHEQKQIHILDIVLLFCQIPEKHISNRIKYASHIENIIRERNFESTFDQNNGLDVFIQHKTKDPKLFHWMQFFKYSVNRNDHISLEFVRSIVEHNKRFVLFECIFEVLLSIPFIVPIVYEYVSCCKEIFFYNSNNTQKDQRIQLIFYSIAVCLKNKVSYIHYNPINISQKEDRFNYLFTMTFTDSQQVKTVQNDIVTKKLSVINNDTTKNLIL